MAKESQNDQYNILISRAVFLERFTIFWNVLGAALLLAVASMTRSVAFSGVGVNALVEILASILAIGYMHNKAKERQKFLSTIITFAFFGLAIYVVTQSGYGLWIKKVSDNTAVTIVGAAWLCLTFLFMIISGAIKRSIGKGTNDDYFTDESKVTFIDAYLILVIALIIFFKFFTNSWWADPVAGLAIVYHSIRKGIAASD